MEKKERREPKRKKTIKWNTKTAIVETTNYKRSGQQQLRRLTDYQDTERGLQPPVKAMRSAFFWQPPCESISWKGFWLYFSIANRRKGVPAHDRSKWCTGPLWQWTMVCNSSLCILQRMKIEIKCYRDCDATWNDEKNKDFSCVIIGGLRLFCKQTHDMERRLFKTIYESENSSLELRGLLAIREKYLWHITQQTMNVDCIGHEGKIYLAQLPKLWIIESESTGEKATSLQNKLCLKIQILWCRWEAHYRPLVPQS